MKTMSQQQKKYADKLDAIYGPVYEAALERSRQVLLCEVATGKKTEDEAGDWLDGMIESLEIDPKERMITFTEYTSRELKMHVLVF